MLNKNVARDHIVLPHSSKYESLPPEEQILIKEAIIGIKTAQLSALLTDILPCINMIIDFEDWEKTKHLLKIMVLERAGADELREIYELDYNDKDKAADKQLRRTLEAMNLGDDKEQVYLQLYNLRHQYLLDKSYRTDNKNVKSFPEKNSHRKLIIGHSKISTYLLGNHTACTDPQKKALQRFYPHALLESKMFRREAHLDIALTIKEIHTLILSLVDYIVENRKTLDEPLQLKAIAQCYNNLSSYTHASAFQLIQTGQLGDFITYLTNHNLTASYRNYHDGVSFLASAVQNQRENFVAWLLEHGAKPSMTIRNYSCLHYAVEGNNLEIVKAILNHQTVIDTVDEGGYTPLYVACELGKEEAVKILLAAGADPNIQTNRHKNTCLHIAVRMGQLSVINTLLASTKCKLELIDAKGKSAYSSDLESKDGQGVQEIFKKYLSLILQSKAQAIQVKASQPPAAKQLPAQLTATQSSIISQDALVEILLNLNSAKLRRNLSQVVKKILTAPVPEISSVSPLGKTENNVTFVTKIADSLQRQRADLVSKQEKLAYITKVLGNLVAQKATFARTYADILVLAKQVNEAQISWYRFAFELIRYGLVEHWITILDKKTVLQVAIDGEDLEVIIEELKIQPLRNYKVCYKNNEYTELEYAIATGKTLAVEQMLKLSEEHAAINLGSIPSNAMESAEQHKSNMRTLNPAFKEVEEYYDINVVLSSEQNIIRLLRDLNNGVDKNQAAINGLFTPDEYKLVGMLLNDKHKELSAENQARRLNTKRKRLALRLERLFQEFTTSPQLELENESYFSLHGIAEVIDRFKSRRKDLEHTQKKRLDNLPPPDAPKIKNILKHATDNADQIILAGEITTVQEAINKGTIRFSSTPEGTRSNIFFSQNSELANLTPLRKNASHVVEVNIAKVMKDRLIAADQVYTTPHIAAFKIERVEAPIVFIGEDASKKTIYRVYHYATDGKPNKTHVYEYYENDQYVGAYTENYRMDEEFFVGDNIKVTAYRLIRHLRATKGPFTEGSYYHYVLKNYDKPQVINSAKAAFFNVLNCEEKITKNLPVHHSAITIIPNKQAPSIELSIVHRAELTRLLLVRDLAGFAKRFDEIGAKKEQIDFTIHLAIVEKDVNLLKFLLAKGITINYENNAPLRGLLSLLGTAYYKSKDIEAPDVVTYLEMLQLLLLQGNADENDPTHIFYANTADSLGLPHGNNWSGNKSADLLEIYRFITHFEDQIGVILFLLNTVHKYLPSVYSMSAKLGMVALHKELASRLSLSNMFETCQPLIKLIDENNLGYLRRSLDEILASSNNAETMAILLSHAIKKANMAAVILLYPYFKSSQVYETSYSPAYIALKHNQPDICLKLYQLGESLDQPHINGETPLLLADQMNYEQVLDAYVKDIKDPAKILNCSIEQGNHNLTTKLCSAYNCESSLSANDELHVGDPIYTAIRVDNAKAIELLIQVVREKSPGKLSRLLGLALLVAMKSNGLAAVRKLAELVINHCPDLFNIARSNLLINIVVHSQLQALDVCFQVIASFPKNKQFLLATRSDRTFLEIILIIHDRQKLELSLERFPILGTMFAKHPAARMYSILFKRSLAKDLNVRQVDIEFLNFIFERGIVPKPRALSEQLALLANALDSGYLSVVKWFFDNHILNKELLRAAKPKEIFDIAFGARQVAGGKDSIEKLKEIFKYLFEVVGFDLNQIDEEGKSLFIYVIDVTNLTAVQALREYLVESNLVNLNQCDKHGRSILHTKLSPKVYLQAVEKYVADGGDIHVRFQDFTILEWQYLQEAEEEVSSALAAKGVSARRVIFDNQIELYITTCPEPSGLYFLGSKKNGTYLYSDEPYYPLANQSSNSSNKYSIKFGINIRRRTLSSRPSKFQGSDCQWVNAREILTSIPEASAEPNHVMIKALLQEQRFITQSLLTSEVSAICLSAITAMTDDLIAIHSSILNGQMPNFSQERMHQVLTRAVIALSLKFRVGNRYEVHKITSPIQTAVIAGHHELLEKFLKMGFKDSNQLDGDNSFLVALKKQELVSFTLLVNFYDGHPSFWLHLLPKIFQHQFENIADRVKYLDVIIAKVKSLGGQFTRDKVAQLLNGYLTHINKEELPVLIAAITTLSIPGEVPARKKRSGKTKVEVKIASPESSEEMADKTARKRKGSGEESVGAAKEQRPEGRVETPAPAAAGTPAASNVTNFFKKRAGQQPKQPPAKASRVKDEESAQGPTPSQR